MECKDFEPSIIQDNQDNIYINISKAFSSSLVERVDASIALNSFVPIKDIAETKGLTSTRSIRLELNKAESKYISREVNGGTTYEILFSSLEPELQRILCRANVSDSKRSLEVAKSKVNDNDSEANDCFLWNKIQDNLLRKNETKSTALVPLNYQPPQFVSDNAKITAKFRINIVLSLIKFRKGYSTKKQADSDF